MQKGLAIYRNLGYWVLALIVLAFAGFYTSYLAVLFDTTAPVIHVHFVLMALWMIMLAAQPFLIKYKKLSAHRLLGKISYVLVPLVLLSGFLMIRHAYYREIDRLTQESARGLHAFNADKVVQQVAPFMALPLVWFAWFILFYILAVINRHRPATHARFMLATALSLLGPIVDRIAFKLTTFAHLRLEAIAFLIADISIAILLLKDYQNKRPTITLLTALLIYVAGQVLYFTVPQTPEWAELVTLMMKPAP